MSSCHVNHVSTHRAFLPSPIVPWIMIVPNAQGLIGSYSDKPMEHVSVLMTNPVYLLMTPDMAVAKNILI